MGNCGISRFSEKNWETQIQPLLRFGGFKVDKNKNLDVSLVYK
jgi:hypothetical protein